MGSACRKISLVNNFRLRPFAQCDLKTKSLYKRPCCSFCIAIVHKVKILGTREGAEEGDAEDLGRKESRAIIGCSQEIALPIFW